MSKDIELTVDLQDSLKQMHDEFAKAITPNEGFDNEYALIDVKELKLSSGVAWTGTLTHKNRAVATVDCDGNGGSYSYDFADSVNEKNFSEAASAAYYGREMFDDEEDCFINYLDLPNLNY